MIYKNVPIDNVVSVNNLYTLYYFHFGEEYFFPGESHDFWEIIYVDEGKISGISGSETYRLEKGQLIFHRPNVFHSLHGDGQGDFRIAVISFDSCSMLESAFSENIFSLTFQERKIIHEIIEEGIQVYGKKSNRNLIYQKNDNNLLEKEHLYGSKQIIKNLLEQLIIHLYRKQQSKSDDRTFVSMQSLDPDYQIVSKIAKFLEKNVYNNIGFISVEEEFQIGATQLKKKFKHVTGYGIMEYYRKLVIEKICFNIREDKLNFSEMSEKFNFSSIYYFSKFFKRETGVNLSEYQKNHRINKEKKFGT